MFFDRGELKADWMKNYRVCATLKKYSMKKGELNIFWSSKVNMSLRKKPT